VLTSHCTVEVEVEVEPDPDWVAEEAYERSPEDIVTHVGEDAVGEAWVSFYSPQWGEKGTWRCRVSQVGWGAWWDSEVVNFLGKSSRNYIPANILPRSALPPEYLEVMPRAMEEMTCVARSLHTLVCAKCRNRNPSTERKIADPVKGSVTAMCSPSTSRDLLLSIRAEILADSARGPWVKRSWWAPSLTLHSTYHLVVVCGGLVERFEHGLHAIAVVKAKVDNPHPTP
jgi:hypothetical protein